MGFVSKATDSVERPSPIRRVAGLAGLRAPLAALLLLVYLLGAVACSSQQVSASPEYAQPQAYGGSYSGGTATGDTQEGAAFAQWVLNQDPGHQYYTDAVVRGDQTLGVKVQPTITKSDTQRLLVSLAQGMARTFPGRPLTVVAFYQSGAKLAQANYDPNSNRIGVQFAQ